MDKKTELKLAYLQGTKDEIKAALIEKGQTVADTDTFRSYAAKIRSIPASTVVEPVLEALTVTENGIYVPGDGVDGFSSITVNVDQSTSPDVRYVTFRNESTGEEYVKPVATGDDCVDVVAKGLWAEPTQESDDQYHYTFYGWGAEDGGAADDTILQNITENKTVYAIFSKTLRTYTITYNDEDGSFLHSETLAYGAMPSYIPTKDGAAFENWTPALATVTGDATYVASWSSVVAAGTCGDNAVWKLSADNVLTISGTGAMSDYASATERPWNAYKTDIVSVVIEDGITQVGKYAFQNCTNLTAVNIPDGVTSIGAYAFQNCTNLTAVNIPDGVTSIGAYAFQNCTNLTSIAIPDSVTSIGNAAFMWCYGLKTVSIGRGITIISQSLFHTCTSLSSITIPDTVTRINAMAFYKTSLTSIEIPASVSSIDKSAFQYCSQLASIVIADGNSVYHSNGNCIIKTDTKELVIGCAGSVIPTDGSVTSIGASAFYGCTSLTSIVIPDCVTSIGNYAFYECENLTSVTIGSGVTTIGTYAFQYAGLTSAVFSVTSGWYVTTTSGATSGTTVAVTSATTAATRLITTYYKYYWYRS